MKRQIWKFKFTVQSEFTIEMPKGAAIITLQSQHGSGAIWAICDTASEKETRKFAIFGTGHNMPSSGIKYIGTYQQLDGLLVWHLFEIIE